MTTKLMPNGQVGRSVARLESRAKVTGRAEYTHNIRLPGMLHAKIVRSTVAHGRIKGIETSDAASVPGVHAVITADDICKLIPEPYFGPAFHDQPILAIGKVRYVVDEFAWECARDPQVCADVVAIVRRPH